jgi:hypothetical protein
MERRSRTRAIRGSSPLWVTPITTGMSRTIRNFLRPWTARGGRSVPLGSMRSSLKNLCEAVERVVRSFLAPRQVPAAQFRGMMEGLEGRQLLSTIDVVDGTLRIFGEKFAANRVTVDLNSSGTTLTATAPGISRSYARSSIRSIQIVTGNEADNVYVRTDLAIPAWIFTGHGNDTIWSGAGADVIVAGAGNDKIWTNAGNDTIYGGDGDDTANGGPGNDAAVSTLFAAIERVWTLADPKTPVYTPPPAPPPANPTPPPTQPTNPAPPTNPTNPSNPAPPQNSNPSNVVGAPTAVIRAYDLNVEVGQAVQVSALNSNLNGGSPSAARFVWDFGNPNGRYNRLVGYNAAHVYDRPGTYPITLWVTNEAGNTARTSVNVQVGNSTRRMIYVSAEGSDSNSGTSPNSPIRTWSKAKSFATSNTEILFRRGDTFGANSTLVVNRAENVLLGAYGTGAKPLIQWTGDPNAGIVFDAYAATRDVTVQDLAFDAPNQHVIKPEGVNFLARNIHFVRAGYAVNSNRFPKGVLVMDSTSPSATGLKEYFAYVQGEDHVYLGNTVANSTRQHILRVDTAHRVLVSHNDFTNLDRRAQGDANDTAKQTITFHDGTYLYAYGNKIAGGRIELGPLGGTDGKRSNPNTWMNEFTKFAVLEANTLFAFVDVSHGTDSNFIRNNVFRIDGGDMITVDGWDDEYRRGTNDLRIINNTGINNARTGNFFEIYGPANGIILSNNLWVAPNQVVGSWDSSPVSIRGGGMSSFREISNNIWGQLQIPSWNRGGVMHVAGMGNSNNFLTPTEWNNLGPVQNDLFVNVSLGSGYKPSSSSAAHNFGKRYGGIFADFDGTIRPSTGGLTVGALQI